MAWTWLDHDFSGETHRKHIGKRPSKVLLNLFGGLEPWHFMTFHSVGNFIIPTDEVIFFRWVGIPPTNIGRWKKSLQKNPKIPA